MKPVAIIPARGGSKRIPRKNIKPFLGKPLISYVIEIALESECFSTVYVSTDCEEIASVAKDAKAVVPFLRSKENSDDFATLSQVLSEFLGQLDQKPEQICCILPTALFTNAKLLQKSFARLNEEAHGVVPVVRYSTPIQRALLMDQDEVRFRWPEHRSTRSQDLSPHFFDSGLFYWLNTASFLEDNQIFSSGMLGFEIPESSCQDIDTQQDWEIAELKYKILNQQEDKENREI